MMFLDASGACNETTLPEFVSRGGRRLPGKGWCACGVPTSRSRIPTSATSVWLGTYHRRRAKERAPSAEGIAVTGDSYPDLFPARESLLETAAEELWDRGGAGLA